MKIEIDGADDAGDRYRNCPPGCIQGHAAKGWLCRRLCGKTDRAGSAEGLCDEKEIVLYGYCASYCSYSALNI